MEREEQAGRGQEEETEEAGKRQMKRKLEGDK
jgi:hypothetical protein